MRFFHVERTGYSLHIWAGPLGIHIWRHVTAYQTIPIGIGWCPNWKDPVE